MNKVIVREVEKTHSWKAGDFCQDKLGVHIIGKDEGELFHVSLSDGHCNWGIPHGAVWLPPKTELQIKIN